MRRDNQILRSGLALLLACSPIIASRDAVAEKYEINVSGAMGEDIDLYFGEIKNGEVMDVCYVDMKELIKATPEYKRIKSERIEEGSGGYSIEIANASARVVKNLYEYSLARGIDLVCSEDSLPYLAVDKPSVEMDITSDIIDYMK